MLAILLFQIERNVSISDILTTLSTVVVMGTFMWKVVRTMQTNGRKREIMWQKYKEDTNTTDADYDL